jgi:hypothetical protein
MIKLSPKWTEWLSWKPETGMGYQVATIVLKDGRRFDQVVILEGKVGKIRGRQDVPFTEEDIAEIILTHDKWDWSQDDWSE